LLFLLTGDLPSLRVSLFSLVPNPRCRGWRGAENTENELGMLEFIHNLVETMDRGLEVFARYVQNRHCALHTNAVLYRQHQSSV
jgi:hypothetical protein